MFERLFKLKKFDANVKTETIAGITTFMTMAYILAVNPLILSHAGMNVGALFTVTAVSAMLATFIMAFWANLPIALAPGLGASAFFTYTIVIGMGYTWQFALTAVLFEGILFILLTACKIREIIVNCIPLSMKKAISCGIGLFIAFIGFVNAGIIKTGMTITQDGKHLSGVPLTLGNICTGSAAVALAGVVIASILHYKRVKGALLYTIIICTLIGIPLGITHVPHHLTIFSLPPSIAPLFFKFQIHNIFNANMLIVVTALLFMELFDTIGTLLGVATKANLLDKNGNLPNIKQALFADAIGTTAGAMLGTSTVTAFVESASGVAEGGRTGMTAMVVGILFFIAMFFSPLFLMIPSAATASALIIVGLFMLSPIKDINFEDFSEGISSFLTIIIMPLSYSIANGIVFGIISYVVMKLLTGKYKELNWFIIALAILFILKLIFLP